MKGPNLPFSYTPGLRYADTALVSGSRHGGGLQEVPLFLNFFVGIADVNEQRATSNGSADVSVDMTSDDVCYIHIRNARRFRRWSAARV
jgi:hypothetical protein